MDSSANSILMHPAVDYYKQWEHHKVGTHVRLCADFIVHIDVNGKLDWETTSAFDEAKNTQEKEAKKTLSAVYGEICIAEGAPTKGLDQDDRQHFLRLLGEALVHWIEGEPDTARQMIAAALSFHRERSEEKSRNWYVQSSIFSAGIFAILGILAWLGKSSLMPYVGASAYYAGLACVAGAVGALFSVFVRSGKLRFKASAGLELHRLEASSRISTGAIAGLIVYLSIKSELLFGALFKDSQNTELILLACLAAGAGERLATSIISKFDDASPELPKQDESSNKGKK